MGVGEYVLTTLEAVRDRERQVAELSNVAFAEYEGAPVVDTDFTAWYLRRPGSTPRLCAAVTRGDELVSLALVAMQRLRLGGDRVRCGIVDTVCTHPDHRGRGLARRVMVAVHDAIRDARGEAAVLYTNPAGTPFGFYSRLGYQTRAHAALITGAVPAAAGSCTVRQAGPDDWPGIRQMVNAACEDLEGFAALDAALWDWHRVSRPAAMPVTLLVAEREGQVVGTAAVAGTEVLLGGRRRQTGFVSDLVYPDAACLQDLLAAAPVASLAALLDRRAPQTRDLETLGFATQVGEVSMVLPLTERAADLLTDARRPWYVMVESVVGV